MRVRLVPYDRSWPKKFAVERALLQEAIGAWAADGIHHVGSTAVPGLDSKPIVDILVGVESLEASRGCFEPLAELRYLAERFAEDRESYTDAKADFIRRVLGSGP